MGGTAEDAGAVERAEKFKRLGGTTEDLRLAGDALEEAIEGVQSVLAVAKVLLHMGIAGGRNALVLAGVPGPLVDLAEKVARHGAEKARGKVAGAS